MQVFKLQQIQQSCEDISTAEVYCDSERREREPVVKSEKSEWGTAFGVNNLRGLMQLTRKQFEKLDGEENRVKVREGLWVLLLKNDPFATQRFERKFQHFKKTLVFHLIKKEIEIVVWGVFLSLNEK